MRIKQISTVAWYDIPGYDGKYQINFYGNVRRSLKNGRYKQLNPYIKSSNGNRVVKLNCKEKVVMSLMRITFIGELPEGKVTYHKNGIKADDCLANIGISTKSEIGKMIGSRHMCEQAVVKISSDGEIVDFYRSIREAGRKNYMSYQTIAGRASGKVKSLYAPDGYVYVFESDSAINKAIRRIEEDNNKKCGVTFVKAPEIVFDF